METKHIFRDIEKTVNKNQYSSNLDQLNQKKIAIDVLSQPYYIDHFLYINSFDKFNEKIIDNAKIALATQAMFYNIPKILSISSYKKIPLFINKKSTKKGPKNKIMIQFPDKNNNSNIINSCPSNSIKNKLLNRSYTSSQDVKFFKVKQDRGINNHFFKKNQFYNTFLTEQNNQSNYSNNNNYNNNNKNDEHDKNNNKTSIKETDEIIMNTKVSFNLKRRQTLSKKLLNNNDSNNLFLSTTNITHFDNLAYNKSLTQLKDDNNYLKITKNKEISKNRKEKIEKNINLVRQINSMDLKPDSQKIKADLSDVEKFIRPKMIKPYNTQFSVIKMFRLPSDYKNIKSNLNKDTYSFRIKTAPNLMKKAQEDKIIKSMNLKSERVTSNSITRTKFLNINKNANRFSYRKESSRLITHTSNILKETNKILNKTKIIDEKTDFREKFIEQHKQAAKGWNYEIDENLKKESISKNKSRGYFIYGNGKGYHCQNYDRLFGIEKRVKLALHKLN